VRSKCEVSGLWRAISGTIRGWKIDRDGSEKWRRG
jgi:hypothetical protein